MRVMAGRGLRSVDDGGEALCGVDDGGEALCGVDDGGEGLCGVDDVGWEGLCGVDDGGEALCGADDAPASLGTAATPASSRLVSEIGARRWRHRVSDGGVRSPVRAEPRYHKVDSQACSCARRYASTCSQPEEENNICICIPQRTQTRTSMLKIERDSPACMHGTSRAPATVRDIVHRE